MYVKITTYHKEYPKPNAIYEHGVLF